MGVKFRGAFFEGTASWILTDAVENGRREVAQRGLDYVRAETRVFKHPTGRYYSLLHVIHAGWSSKILPGHLPYVRWLEGTSRRNATTRFKGYHLFRKAAQRLERDVLFIMDKHISPAVRRING